MCESGSLSLCSSSECSSLATVSRRALKWSQGLSRDAEYLWHLGSVFLCASACIYVFPHHAGPPFSALYTRNLASALRWKEALHHLTCMYISSDAACNYKRGVVFFITLKASVFFLKFSIPLHAPTSPMMAGCKDSNERKQEKHKWGKRVWWMGAWCFAVYSIYRASRTDKHIRSQADRETFLDVYDLPRPH